MRYPGINAASQCAGLLLATLALTVLAVRAVMATLFNDPGALA